MYYSTKKYKLKDDENEDREATLPESYPTGPKYFSPTPAEVAGTTTGGMGTPPPGSNASGVGMGPVTSPMTGAITGTGMSPGMSPGMNMGMAPDMGSSGNYAPDMNSGNIPNPPVPTPYMPTTSPTAISPEYNANKPEENIGKKKDPTMSMPDYMSPSTGTMGMSQFPSQYSYPSTMSMYGPYGMGPCGSASMPSMMPSMGPGMGPGMGAGMGPSMSPGMGAGMGPSMSPSMGPSLGSPAGTSTQPPMGQLPALAPTAGPSTSPTPSAPVFGEPSPKTVMDINFTAGYLRTQIGKSMMVSFLIGTSSLVDRVGVLLYVGASYIILRELTSSESLLCDIYSIKFVRIYNTQAPPLSTGM